MTPRFEHDCDSCVFLGRYRFENDPNKRFDYDLYVCGQGDKSFPTVIARFSDELPDYMSGLPSALASYDKASPSFPLLVALQDAYYRGYISISATDKLKEEAEFQLKEKSNGNENWSKTKSY